MDDELSDIPDDFLVLWWKRELVAMHYNDSYVENGADHERTRTLAAQYKLSNREAVDLYNRYRNRVGGDRVHEWWNTVRKVVRGPNGIEFRIVRMTNGRL